MNNISDIIYEKLPQNLYEFTDGDDCDAILVRSADLKKTVLPENLLAIGRAGIGVDNIDIPACSEKGIVVFNTPGANANDVHIHSYSCICNQHAYCAKTYYPQGLSGNFSAGEGFLGFFHGC